MMILDGKSIGPDEQPYFIADMSLNHGGSLKLAKELIVLAKSAGADAIKPQLYTPDELCAPGTIAKDGPWAGEDMWELYRKYQTPRSWIPELIETARRHNITLFFSVFSTTAVSVLESFNVPAYKISTSDYAWSKLRERCRATGKPTFVSVPKMEATPEIPLLNRPGYPCPLHDADLPELKKGTGVFGFSSHVMDPIVFPMAVALGASIIELNIIRSLSEGGPDASFSWEPWQIKQIREDTLKAWRAMRSQEDKAPSMMRNVKTGLREVA
jgi:sialic acid synthase SpsE